MRKALKYLLVLCGSALIGISAYYLYALYNARDYTQTVILADLKSRQWRPFDGVPKAFEIVASDLTDRQKDILLKVQDPGFYEHNGIDLSTPGAGLTTVTQAIVKKLYFKQFRAGIAKIKQSLIARFVVNDMINKNDQITYFINVVFFGRKDGKPVIGLQSASQAYFAKPVDQISEEQFISLIAMIVAPNTFHILDHPEWNKDRTTRIKALVAGDYKPQGLMDQFYGRLPQEAVEAGLPKASYFPPKEP